jgi:hypothetical protein
MGEMSKLGCLVGWSIRDMWAFRCVSVFGVFLMVPSGEFVSPVMTSFLIFLWCKASHVWGFYYFNILSYFSLIVCAVLGLYTPSGVSTSIWR